MEWISIKYTLSKHPAISYKLLILAISYKLFPRQYVFTNYDDVNKKQKFKIYHVELLKYSILPVKMLVLIH